MNLRQLLGLCEHVWKQIEKLQVEAFLPSTPSNKFTVRYEYICQCQKCGTIKKFRV